MPMVRHQTKSRDAYANAVMGFSEDFFKRRIISRLLE
jgi:hypothetical protein